MKSNEVIAKDIKIGMTLAKVGKKVGFGNPGMYGVVKYIHHNNDNIVVSVYAPQVEDNFELKFQHYEVVNILSIIKPYQREALLLKAKVLLNDLSDQLKDHEFGPRLARLNYKLDIS